MQPNQNMSRVVRGKRYSVKISQLIADDVYWDGRNYERMGRNSFLYKTSGGAFFKVFLTQWVNELNSIEVLSREEAMEMYERLPEHSVSYEAAFDVVVEEASSDENNGSEPMREISIWLPEPQIQWLQEHPDPLGKTISGLVAGAMI
jgi:hypothetical protein